MKPDTPKFATYRYPENGYPRDQKTVKAHLKLGRTYAVDREEVGNFHTDVFLMAFPGIAFNSVMFDIVPVIMGAAPKPDRVGVEHVNEAYYILSQIYPVSYVWCKSDIHRAITLLKHSGLLAVKEKA